MESSKVPPDLPDFLKNPPPGVKVYFNAEGALVTESHPSADPGNMWMPLACPNCRTDVVLRYSCIKKSLSREDGCGAATIELRGCPVLCCLACNWQSVPPLADTLLEQQVQRASKENATMLDFHDGIAPPQFPWVPDKPFRFDPWEHRYMPGLYRRHDTYLTPVYFKPQVLQKYKHGTNYVVEMESDTYGLIRFPDGHKLPFGVNRRGNVITWLGEIADLPDDEQFYLLSENIASDGDVSSDFYDGQINLGHGAPSKISRLLEARATFNQAVRTRLGKNCTHLDTAVNDLLQRLTPPTPGVIDSELDVIEELCKICVETIWKKPFQHSLEAEGIGFDARLGSLKTLQTWLESVAGIRDACDRLSPLFILRNLRNVGAHLHVAHRKREIIEETAERLGLNKSCGVPAVYDALVEALTRMYSDLAEQLGTALSE